MVELNKYEATIKFGDGEVTFDRPHVENKSAEMKLILNLSTADPFDVEERLEEALENTVFDVEDRAETENTITIETSVEKLDYAQLEDVLSTYVGEDPMDQPMRYNAFSNNSPGFAVVKFSTIQ